MAESFRSDAFSTDSFSADAFDFGLLGVELEYPFNADPRQMGTWRGDSKELGVQTLGREMKKNSPIFPNARTTTRREVSQAKGNNPPDLPY